MAIITGTAGNDSLSGMAAADSIYALAGNDTIDGGDGDDLIEGGDGDDVIQGGLGTDTIYAGAGNDFLIAAADPIGDVGLVNQVFLSRDALAGGPGDDVYLVYSNNRIGEDVGGGFDTVYTKYGFSLNFGAEVEVLAAADARDTRAINLLGNEFTQTIVGNYGNNLIYGGGNGGRAADTLIGLLGDDTYYVAGPDVVIVENPGEGNDTVRVTRGAGANNYILPENVSIEVLQADFGSDPINMTGNTQAQTLIGNDGANILSSGGGAADTMNGGFGDDIYRVFSLGDTVDDTGGFDTIYASGTSYFLSTGAQIEYLSSSFQAGTDPIYLVGNAASQVIAGNYGANILDGGGGGATDTLIGLRGDDVYRVYQQGDIVRETAGEGNDTVYTSADYQLRTGVSVEALSAENQTANGAGAAYTLRGNEAAQTIVGNDAANVLDGRGGNDTLIGRGGNDTFAFTTALDATGNVDTIRDFGTFDRIGLATDVFAAVTEGGITFGEFVTGTTALDSDDRLLYDQATGRLFYDADANGSGAAVLFAQLTPGTTLASFSFTAIPPVGDLPAV